MLKKIFISIGVFVAVLAAIVVAAGIFIMLKIDKTYIESQMSKGLNRQVHIEKMDVGIFSIVSGIEVKKISISNFKSPQELAILKGKPVSPSDLFIGMDSLRFKVKLLPLLKRQLDLKELVFYSPIVNLTRNKQGVMNCDDLIKSKKPAKESSSEPVRRSADTDKSPAPEKAMGEKSKSAAVEGAKPLSADDIPIAANVGQIGIKNGTINYHDGEYDQKFQIYKFTALAYDIKIDPSDLERNDEIKLKIFMGLKTAGPMKTGSVKDFDITFDSQGKVKPFDTKTRLLDPEINMHAGFPDGQITGLQIFNSLASIPLLGDYLGERIAFLKEKQEWKGSKECYVDVRYKNNNAELSNGKLDLKDFNMLFAGTVDTKSKALDINLNLALKKEINSAVKTDLAKTIDSAIKSRDARKYVDPGKLAEAAMQPLLNKNGVIDMKFKVTGTTKKSDVKLVQPQLDSLDSVIKKAAGNVLLEAGKSATKELVGEGQKKILEAVPDLFKK